jgi:hypothetical protein
MRHDAQGCLWFLVGGLIGFQQEEVDADHFNHQ